MKNFILKTGKSLLMAAVILAVGLAWFSVLESASATAASSTVTSTTTGIGNAVELTYPVEVTLTAELTLTCDTATSTMLSNIAGITGGSATSSRGCLVKTNNTLGWTMTTHASDTPALVHTASTTINFPDADATPATWSSPAASTSKFGFNASGTYADAAFSGDKYRGFNGTTPITVASDDAATDSNGIMTYMNFKAEVGNAASQTTGLYRAWVTITAYMN